jgi:hypothetical protein
MDRIKYFVSILFSLPFLVFGYKFFHIVFSLIFLIFTFPNIFTIISCVVSSSEFTYYIKMRSNFI